MKAITSTGDEGLALEKISVLRTVIDTIGGTLQADALRRDLDLRLTECYLLLTGGKPGLLRLVQYSAALKSFEVRDLIARGRVLFYCRLNKANVIIVGFDITDGCTGYAHLESDEDKYVQVDLSCLELPR